MILFVKDVFDDAFKHEPDVDVDDTSEVAMDIIAE